VIQLAEMQVAFAGCVPKERQYPEANEDCFALSDGCARVAVSDGASESFDSRMWAGVLAETFTAGRVFDRNALIQATQRYAEKYRLSELKWSQQASFARGSFATLLGVEYQRTGARVRSLAVGDTLAVLLDGLDLVDSFPYTASAQFSNRPELFSTRMDQNGFFSKKEFPLRHSRKWFIGGLRSPALLCMTDALGQWALRRAEEGAPQWATLINVTQAAELEALVEDERQKKRLRVDDTTLISLLFA